METLGLKDKNGSRDQTTEFKITFLSFFFLNQGEHLEI